MPIVICPICVAKIDHACGMKINEVLRIHNRSFHKEKSDAYEVVYSYEPEQEIIQEQPAETTAETSAEIELDTSQMIRTKKSKRKYEQ